MQFSLIWPSGPIQSLSCDVYQSCVCVSVCVCVCHRRNSDFLVDWILLIKEHFANIGITLDTFCFLLFFIDFLSFDTLLGFWVFANQPVVHNGGFNRGRSVAVAFGVSDR